MNQLILLAVVEPENPIQQISRTFGLDKAHFFAQVVSFLLVALALYKFAYHPILKVLEERRQRIEVQLADTEKTRLEVLNQANVQANKLIAEAREAAARVQEQETQKAIAAAEQIIAKAREAAAADHARMLTELRREVGRLVVDTTSKVTGKVLTADDQKRLGEETTRQLSA
jgi:F-type H+-transporting ATPase subunit b